MVEVSLAQVDPNVFALPRAVELLEYLTDIYDEHISVIDQLEVGRFLERYYEKYGKDAT